MKYCQLGIYGQIYPFAFRSSLGLGSRKLLQAKGYIWPYIPPLVLIRIQYLLWIREGLKKRQIIHILWISVLPPPPYPRRPKLIIFTIRNFHRIGPLGRFDLVVPMSVCVLVCLFDIPFHVVYFEAYFAPTSRSRMSKFLEIWNPWGKVLERSGLRIELFCWDVV